MKSSILLLGFQLAISAQGLASSMETCVYEVKVLEVVNFAKLNESVSENKKWLF